jgi:SAM-dependent methyltransferase
VSAAKQSLIRGLRRLSLLSLADDCIYALRQLQAGRGQRDFAARHPEFATPPPRIAFEAFHNVDWDSYRSSGLHHARLFARLIAERRTGDPLRILEWGCGPGRLARHMAGGLGPRRVELTAVDSDPSAIAWCRAHLPGIAFQKTLPLPPLPFEGNHFDAVYAFSVLTHLAEETQARWMAELRRVLRPGGVLVVTVHGDRYRGDLDPRERALYDEGKVVARGGIPEGRKWFLAYHPPRAMRERLLEGFRDVVHLPCPIPEPEEYELLQDVWVASKPEGDEDGLPPGSRAS